jgi:hypothetical protein
MPDEPADFERYADIIDDLVSEGGTAIPLRGIRIIDFLNQDGIVGTTWHIDGDEVQTREALAMLEIARLQVGANVVRESLED